MADTDPAELTSDQITEAVANAIRSRDFDAVPPLIRLLAVRDPDGAQLLLDTITLGLYLGAHNA